MPVVFTDERKRVIIHSLVENGIELFGIFGFKKTTVDELADRSSISKGSFYTFFPSKEHLLLHCFVRLHERIADELTSSILRISNSPEESIRLLLQAAPVLPVTYPVIKEYYNPGLQNMLLQIAEDLTIARREFTPAPNFGTVLAHWELQGFVVDANPQDLEQAVELLSSHTAVFGYEKLKKGIDLLIEFSSIGSTGFIREKTSARA